MIKVRPRKHCRPLTELDHITVFPIRMEFARELVGYMQLGTDAEGGAVFMGRIWDEPEDDIAYPSSPFDLRVRDGVPMITCPVLFAKGLLAAWAEQFMAQDMIIQVPA